MPKVISKKKRRENLREIIICLDRLKKALEKEDPEPLFTWTLESKMRAYGKKLKKTYHD